ncbi:DUF7695 domain-containing protein [Clostridium butyricum]|nr:hypothetical protein [Clostridium butyricum]AXB86055.1 hypothetical protein DRB99_14065 [Clostridium butyricum]
MKRILQNKIKCLKCGDVIESTSIHNMVWCKCLSCAVDGGKEYVRFTGEENTYAIMTEYEDEGNV